MLWLYLLGAVTVLAIAVRRLKQRQKPLDDQVFSHQVAIDNVRDGVAFVGTDGRFQQVNPALADMLRTTTPQLIGRDWMDIFPRSEHGDVEAKYSQMLLAGRSSMETLTLDSSRRESAHELLLIAVHDHKMRFMGHHCIVERAYDEPSLRVSTAGFATLAN